MVRCVAGGGTSSAIRLLRVSGAEILWDLDYRGSDEDKQFAQEVLGASMNEDDANETSGYGLGPLEGISFSFDVVDGGKYHVEYPDSITSDRGVIAKYDNDQVAGVFGNGVVLLGFPFETIGSLQTRQQILAILLPLLIEGYEMPEGSPSEPSNESTEPSNESTGPSNEQQDSTETFPVFPKESVEDLSKGCGCSYSDRYGGFPIALVLLAFLRRRKE